MASITDITKGARYLIQGSRLLGHKRVLPFVAIPLLINIALYYFVFTGLYDYFNQWLDNWISSIPELLSFISAVLKLVFVLGAIVVSAFSFSIIANVIGSPFYGYIAEQIIRIKGETLVEHRLTPAFILHLTLRTISREAQKILHYLLRVIPLLIAALVLSFTPLSFIVPFIWFWFGASMLALQYLDYGFDNDDKAFAEVKHAVKKDRWTSLGFGSLATVASMIPIINILAVPASVCGGTLFYVERLREKDCQQMTAT